MSEFEKYIEAKYPNRSPKILFQKFKDIDGTLFYGVKEIEDQAKVWQHQQAKIDDSENTRAVLYRENIDLRERNTDLQAKIDELEKQLIAQGQNFNDQSQNVRDLEFRNGELQKRINKAISKWIAITSIVTTQRNGLPDEFYQKLDQLHDVLTGFDEALRGAHE